MRIWRKLIVVLLGVVPLSVDACGSSSSPSHSANGSSSQGVKAATADINALYGLPKFVSPGGPLDAKKIAAGKVFFTIPITDSIPYAVAMEAATKRAVTTAGGTYMTWPNTGQTDQWRSGIAEAMREHAAVLILNAELDVRNIGPELAQARAAGIKVIASGFTTPSQPCPSYVDVCVTNVDAVIAREMTDYAISKTNGNGDYLVISSPDVYSSGPMTATIKQTLAKNCPNCKAKYMAVTVNNWSTQITPQVEAALVADPNINYVICIYDTMDQYVVPALLARGRLGKVGVTGFDGTPGPMSLLQKGDTTVDVGDDIQWIAYATVDAGMRALSGTPPDKGNVDEHFPQRVFDKTDASSAGSPPSLMNGYGNAAEAGYKQLWGLG